MTGVTTAEERLTAATGTRESSRTVTLALETEAAGTKRWPEAWNAAEAFEKEAAVTGSRIKVRTVTEALEEASAAVPNRPIPTYTAALDRAAAPTRGRKTSSIFAVALEAVAAATGTRQ